MDRSVSTVVVKQGNKRSGKPHGLQRELFPDVAPSPDRQAWSENAKTPNASEQALKTLRGGLDPALEKKTQCQPAASVLKFSRLAKRQRFSPSR